THHHLLLDGWSLPLVLNEVLAHYEAQVRGRTLDLAPARPYQDYIAWLQRQDLAQAAAFWRQTLAGFHAATPLGVDHTSGAATSMDSDGDQEVLLDEDTSAALQGLARAHGLTLSTLIQGAWALLLSRY